MNDAEIKAAAAREDVCRYLAACYYEPDPAFEEERMFASLLAAATRFDERLAAQAARLGAAFSAAALEDLLLDYTRLFLGPPAALAKPYGSVWLEGGHLMGDSTLSVVDLYREADFEVDEAFLELPDHVAVELEFLYLLTFREHEALLAGDADALGRVRDLKRRFLEQHLGRWIGDFTAAVAANSGSAFYRQLAETTRLFVDMQAASIGTA